MTSRPPGSKENGILKDTEPHFSLLEASEEAKLLGEIVDEIEGVQDGEADDQLIISPDNEHFNRLRYSSAPAIRNGAGQSLRSISLPKGPASQTDPCMKHACSLATVDSQSQHQFPEAKKAKKVVSDYYKKQNELLEDFKNDSEQIQVFQRTRTRQRLQSSSSQPPEGMADVPEEKEAEQATMASSSVAPIALEESIETPRPEEVIEPPLPPKKNSTLAVEASKKNSSLNLRVPSSASLSGSIESLDSKQSMIARHEAAADKARDESKAAARFAMITLFVNISLMLAKAVASYISGSISIISSLVDSLVDITSGLVISVCSRMIRKRDPYRYPRGRTRLEPLSLIIISVVMGVASVQLIYDAVHRIYMAVLWDTRDESSDPNLEEPKLEMNWPTVGIMLTTVGIKFTLFLICQKYKGDPSIEVLAMDHRNDCISNVAALIFAYTARWIYYLDPIGAIIVSIYILYTWVNTGMEHLSKLSGRSAEPKFINRITKVCMDHDPRITHLDTVLVYHYGTKFLVEVHIVLDPTMCLKEAHDISESLQTCIESLPDVERAFVHPDYEYQHLPGDEHKVV